MEDLEARRMFDAGSIDTFFAGGKTVTRTAGAAFAVAAHEMDVYPQGQVLLTAGTRRVTPQASGNGYVFVWRMRPDGSADMTFGADKSGQVAMKIPDDSAIVSAGSVNLQRVAAVVAPDYGVIVEIGWRLYKLKSNGVLNSSFGTGGMATVSDFARQKGDNFTRLLGMGVDSKGRIYVMGRVGDNSTGSIEIERFSASGVRDQSYGGKGTLAVTPLLQSNAVAMAVMPLGSVVVEGILTTAGLEQDGYTMQYISARYKSDGTPETTFGTNGVVSGSVSGVTGMSGSRVTPLKVLEDGTSLFVIENFTTPGIDEMVDSRQVVGFGPLGESLGAVIQSTPDQALPLNVVSDLGRTVAAMNGVPNWIDTHGHVMNTETQNAAASLGANPNVDELAVETDSTLLTLQVVQEDAVTGAGGVISIQRLFFTDSPVGMLEAPTIRAVKSGSYHFNVVWRDDDGVDLSTLQSPLQVVLPNGTTKKAYFSSADTATNAKVVTATYRLAAPGGRWDSTDNGNYIVKIVKGTVKDINGNGAARQSIGVFAVTIPISASSISPLAATNSGSAPAPLRLDRNDVLENVRAGF